MEILNKENVISASYEIKGSSENDEVYICLVSLKEITSIKRGENGGRTITNTNIVLQMSDGQKESKSKFEFERPEKFGENGLAIVAFVSDSKTMEVKAAKMVKL